VSEPECTACAPGTGLWAAAPPSRRLLLAAAARHPFLADQRLRAAVKCLRTTMSTGPLRPCVERRCWGAEAGELGRDRERYPELRPVGARRRCRHCPVHLSKGHPSQEPKPVAGFSHWLGGLGTDVANAASVSHPSLYGTGCSPRSHSCTGAQVCSAAVNVPRQTPALRHTCG